ncbi:hypothetical protein GJAV_G00248530 [Gymnothorax javanicus]|nr:hypothetical protein GJAV_G00248530 [Gymnothorax javanicus]
MSGTVRACIVDALDNLDEDQRVRFKYELSNRKRIGYGLIEKERTVQIAQRIISKFTTDGAIACVADVLRAIGLEDEAKSLEGEGRDCRGAPAAAGPGGTCSLPRGGAGGSVCSEETEDEHFVDKNQVELIKRITSVKPILDHLLHKKLMSSEMYNLVDAERTNEDKMRKLIYDVITPLGLRGKDELVWILDEEQPYIMETLRGK